LLRFLEKSRNHFHFRFRFGILTAIYTGRLDRPSRIRLVPVGWLFGHPAKFSTRLLWTRALSPLTVMPAVCSAAKM
jgi:hypothetical protein